MRKHVWYMASANTLCLPYQLYIIRFVEESHKCGNCVAVDQSQGSSWLKAQVYD